MSEEESPDHTTLTFKIDPAARFWDGSKVTAEDVVWSYERWISQKPPDSGANNAILLLDSVKAPDSSTVVVKFKAPNTLRLRGGVHAPRGWNIASRAYYEKVGEESFRKIPMATGPYRILANEPQAYVELEAIENHWALSPQIKKIRMELVAEQATRIARLQTGEAAFADGVLGPQLPMLEADNNLQVYESKASAKATIYFHSPDVAPYSDQRFRKALGLLIDQPTIIKTLFQGHGTPSPSAHMFPSLDIWDEKLFPAQAFNPEEARKLLAEAGYGNGAKVKLNFYDSSSAPLIPDTSLAIANMWRKEKIEVELQQTEAGAYFEKYRSKTIGDIAVLGSGSGTAGEGYLITFYASPAAYGAPVPQDMQDAIRALSQEFDEAKHTEKTRAIFKRIIDEAWSITMPWGNSIWVARKDKIKDWKVFPANGYPASFYTMVPA
jgi:peptide/nickel transport system substrate-binding protein